MPVFTDIASAVITVGEDGGGEEAATIAHGGTGNEADRCWLGAASAG